MNQLEQRYRAVLRLLPAAYRRQWEDDMVAAFLASTHDDDPERAEYLADFGRPSWSEVGSVAALAIRLRLGIAGGASPRADARREAARIVVLLWLLAGAVTAIVGFGAHLWLMGVLPLLPGPEVVAPVTGWPVAEQLLGLAWPVAYLALVLGRTTIARVAALVGVATSLARIPLAIVDEVVRNRPTLSVSMVVTFALDAGLLALLWALGRAWPPVRRGRWLVALVVVTAAMTALIAGAAAGVLPWWAVDWVAVGSATLTAGVIVHLATGGHPSWSLALAVLAWTMLGLRVLTLADVAMDQGWVGPVPFAFAAAEALALFLVAVPTTIVALRAQTRLAPNPPAPRS